MWHLNPSDLAQEGVAHAGASAGALDESRDVLDFHLPGHRALGPAELGESVKAEVRHAHLAPAPRSTFQGVKGMVLVGFSGFVRGFGGFCRCVSWFWRPLEVLRDFSRRSNGFKWPSNAF